MVWCPAWEVSYQKDNSALSRTIIISILIFGCIAGSHAQTPLELLDAFTDAVSKPTVEVDTFFTENARVSSLIYLENDETKHQHQSPSEFKAQLQNIHVDFIMNQTPLVLVYREYKTVASIFSSVFVQFKEKSTGEVIETTNMQSLKFVLDDDGWRISQLSIQNEHPSYPIDSVMQPESLKNKYRNRKAATIERVQVEPMRDARPLDDFSTEYDPNKVYNVNEVDEIPVYPTGQEGLNQVLRQFNVVTQQQVGYTPFIVTIEEDGSPTLTYTHDLSGFQIAQAESFVRSMLFWYPAIKYAASVKCKLIFYIRD